MKRFPNLDALMPDFLRETSLGQKLLTDHYAEIATERRTAIDAIAAACEAQRAGRPALDAKLEKGQADVARKLEALLAAQRAVAATMKARHDLTAAADAVQRQFMPMLRATAPTVIREFAAWAHDELDRVRRTGPLTQQGIQKQKRHWSQTDDHAKIEFMSNAEGVADVIRALVGAMREAQTLHERVVSREDAEREIARLRASIPYERLKDFDSSLAFADSAA